MTQQQREGIVKMWSQGLSAKEIAKRLGIKTEAVFNFASNHRDICPYRNRVASDGEYADMIQMWEEGASVKQLADHFGRTRASMATRIYRHRDLFPYRYRVKRVREAEGTEE